MRKSLLILAAVALVAGCHTLAPLPTPQQVRDREAYEAGVEAGYAQAIHDIGPTPVPSPTPNEYQRGFNQGYMNALEGE